MKTSSLVVLVELCGCSSIIEGRSQEIVLNTNPAGELYAAAERLPDRHCIPNT
jgi:hypothetical protein